MALARVARTMLPLALFLGVASVPAFAQARDGVVVEHGEEVAQVPQPRPSGAGSSGGSPQGQPGQPAQARPAAAPPAPPLRAFVRPALVERARRFEASRVNARPTDQRPIPDIRRDADAAMQRGDGRAASRLWEQIALRSGQDGAPWVRFSQALALVRSENWQERQTIADEILGAAYLGYQRATNAAEEGFALAQLRQIFAARQQWRDAIDAAKAAMDARDTPESREAYTRLREQHGFRIVRTNVDSDTANPRACFVFSEPLRRGRFDFAPFVRQEGVANPTVTVEERQICVDGLRHGERYRFQVREGLPSDIGENLLRTSDQTVYVRDRTQSVRFPTRAYVLPRTGQRGVPVVSINVPLIDVEIVRFGDRSIAQTVGEEFPRPLEPFELQQLMTNAGMPAWKGQLTVEPRLNQEVTTAFPMDEAVRTLEPGVYVMTAKPNAPRRPASEGEDVDQTLAAQWFIVSDLGLTGLSGVDGVHGFVHSLASAQPIADAEVRLLARNNEVLATRRTDASGHVRFERGLARGEGALQPSLLVAIGANGDYSFLNLRQPAFDLSDRGVAGREVNGPLDAFLVPERGIYRPGETIQLTVLLRDAKGDAVPNVPLIVSVERPDGVEYRRVVTQDQGAGGRALAIPILSTAPTGTWRIKALADPRQPAVGEVRVMIEDFVPDRIDFEVRPTSPSIQRAQPAQAEVNARYLFGLPAANLPIEGEVVLRTADELPGFAGYVFGLEDEEAINDREPIPDGARTDDNGRARLSVPLPRTEASTKPLAARLNVRIAEPGGRAVERSADIAVAPGRPLIGVKPGFEDDRIAEDETAGFELVAIGPDGRTRQAKTVTWQVLRLETRWQWTRRDGLWSSTAIVSTRRIADGRIELGANAVGRVTTPRLPWGQYRLEVTDAANAETQTTYVFESGYGAGGTADTPDVLEMSLDKASYASGETMRVSLNARFSGIATVTILGDRLIAQRTLPVSEGRSTIEMPVGTDWGAGAYAVVFLRRPLDAQANRMPGRAIGLGWFGVDTATRRISVALEAPERMAPRQALRVPIRVQGLAPGEEARVTLAAVDLGILTLTNYQPPKPEDQFLGQRRLQAEVRDLYGMLLDGMNATRGAIRVGGDAPPPRFATAPPAQEPVSLFSGILTPDAEGRAEAVFDIPDFNGTIRLMAMAWTPTKAGSGTRDVIARDPVVVSATMPRVLGSADRGTLRLDLVNAEAPAGDYQITVTPEGPVQVATQPTTVRLTPGGGRGAASLPITANGTGIARLAVRLTGPGGVDVTSTYRLGVRPGLPDVTRRTILAMEPGQAIAVSSDLIGDFERGSARVSVSVAPSSAIDIPGLVQSLDRYPYGCTEQITSRALPLLYLEALQAQEGALALESPVRERLADAIERVLSRQSSTGSFGLWAAGENDDAWLDAFVTDFLIRARERGFQVPARAIESAIDRLRTLVTSTQGVGDMGGVDLAYAHYVLARAGRGAISDLRWLADTQLNEFKTALGRGQIAAALALLGDQTRAERVFGVALRQVAGTDQQDQGRFDYGSRLRDAAAMMALTTETRMPRALIDGARRAVEDMRPRVRWPSTQEKVWLVLAAQGLVEEGRRITLDVGGQAHVGTLSRTLTTAELGNGLTLRNTTGQALRAVVSVLGTPVVPEPPASAGFSIERRYLTLQGQPVDIARVAQGTRLVVVLRVTEQRVQQGDLMLVDRLPAGFEIDNPSLVQSAETSAMRWLEPEKEQPIWRAFRDDRFQAAYKRAEGDDPSWRVAYVIRAVTPGRFLLPPATIEDMYRPERMARTGTQQVEVTGGR